MAGNHNLVVRLLQWAYNNLIQCIYPTTLREYLSCQAPLQVIVDVYSLMPKCFILVRQATESLPSGVSSRGTSRSSTLPTIVSCLFRASFALCLALTLLDLVRPCPTCRKTTRKTRTSATSPTNAPNLVPTSANPTRKCPYQPPSKTPSTMTRNTGKQWSTARCRPRQTAKYVMLRKFGIPHPTSTSNTAITTPHHTTPHHPPEPETISDHLFSQLRLPHPHNPPLRPPLRSLHIRYR